MTTTPDLLILESSWQRLESRIRQVVPDIRASVMNEHGKVTVDGKPVPVEQLRSTLGWINLDVYTSPVRREYVQALLRIESLRWVQAAAAGVEDPVFAKLVHKGITLTNSDSQAPAIADFILAAALDYFQLQDQRRERQAAHDWQRIPFRELADTSWLIVGYGHIGRETARRASAFRASITGIRRRVPAKQDEFAHQVATLDRLPQLLPQADVVVLSVGLNEVTRNLANAEFFARMKHGSLLVNIGRGGLVDETALLDALNRDAPGRAALDVFHTEPLPQDSPLWNHPKIRVTAHASNQGSSTPRRGDELFLDNLQRYMRGSELRNPAKKDDLPS